MTQFQFDTSGYVKVTDFSRGHKCFWSDLNPFVQGYGHAMAQALYERLVSGGMSPEAANSAVAFHNWAPETLARIIEDCNRFQRITGGMIVRAQSGKSFWFDRQEGLFDPEMNFPRLTIAINDLGKVVFL